MRERRLNGHDDGFTVVEVLVALGILLIACVALLQVYAFASVSTNMNAARERATDLGNERIERIRNLAYDSVGTVGGDPEGSIPEVEEADGYTVTTDVSWARDAATGRATYKRVEVTVAWSDPRESSISVSTNVYGQSALVNTGDVLVSVVDRDTGEEISNVAVVVTPDGHSARTVRTDANGEAFFGYVPTGGISVSCAVPGYLVDLSTVEGAEVTADTLTRLVINAQRPSTAIVHVTSMTWVDIPGAVVTLTDPYGATRAVTTGSEGLATFDDLLIGAYTINVTAAGRIPSSGALEITEGGQTVTAAIKLADPAPLTVIVKDSGGAAVKGATVRVQTSGGADIAGSPKVTADSGAATFDIASTDTYLITASKTGYATVVRSVYLTTAGAEVEVVLVPITTGTIIVSNTKNQAIKVSIYHVTTGRYVVQNATVPRRDWVAFPNLATGQYYVYKGTSRVSVYVSTGTFQTVTWGGSWQ